MGFLEGMWL